MYNSSVLSIQLPIWDCDAASMAGRHAQGVALLDAVITDMPLKYFDRVVVSRDTNHMDTDDPFDLLADTLLVVWYLKHKKQTRLQSMILILPQLSTHDKHVRDSKINEIMSKGAIHGQAEWVCRDVLAYIKVDEGLT